MIKRLVRATHPERPPWANWKASNPDGSVWYFEIKPIWYSDHWWIGYGRRKQIK